MLQAYPNPAKGSACIRYNLAEAGKMKLRILDITGREMMPLMERIQDAGVYQLSWDTQQFPAGCYIIQLQTSKVCVNCRLMIMK